MLASCFFGRAAEMPEKPPNQMKLGIETGSTKHRQHLWNTYLELVNGARFEQFKTKKSEHWVVELKWRTQAIVINIDGFVFTFYEFSKWIITYLLLFIYTRLRLQYSTSKRCIKKWDSNFFNIFYVFLYIEILTRKADLRFYFHEWNEFKKNGQNFGIERNFF